MSSIPFKTSLTLPPLDAQQFPAPMADAICPSDRPLALLPVRLETRFFTRPDSSRELRLRVYPDKVHVDSHEVELTKPERDWGVHYWEQTWRAGRDPQAGAAAWRQLADRFGAARAAWIARVLRPDNPQDRPASAIAPEAALPVAPRFPNAATVLDDEASWRRAPRADLLPDRWIAVVQSRGRPAAVAVGREIARPLTVGPDPKTPAATIPGDQLAIDEGMRWMVDFDAAEANGMALRVTITPALLDAGLDSLFVFGAAASIDPDEAAAQMAGLLDAHHYTDGLGFVRQGTPSNNTTDRRAGYGAEDTGHQRSYESEVLGDPSGLDASSNAMRLGTALGLPREAIGDVLVRIDSGDQTQEQDARSMNAALWQIGWGYALPNLIGQEGGLTPDDLAWARDRFLSAVRAAGPYPAIRCGRQPYGVLPVTSLDHWKPRAGEEPAAARDLWLRDLLVKLRDVVWRPHLKDAARVGQRTPPDPDADLADVMRRDALATGYRARTLFGRQYVQHLRAFMGENVHSSGFARLNDALTGELAARLGIAWRPRVARATYADMWWRVAVPLVQAGEVSPWRPLDPDYIAAFLAEPTVAGLMAHRPDPTTRGDASLLEMLLRHALLREYAQAAAAIAASVPGSDVTALLRDAELVDLPPGTPTANTWTRLLDRVVAPITGSQTIRHFLEGLTAFDAPVVRALGEVRAALAHLRTLDSESLQLLMQGTLDLSAHRLDAWITSFATDRLARMRAASPRGLRVGAYGWVENLLSEAAPAASVTPPPGETGPMIAAANDTGFIHAPSLTHAATAALLRNAHLGHNNAAQAESAFAIDLSSRRVRDAVWLLDGIRQGQPLGALLGYRLERSLHAMGLDRLIARLRDLAPLTARRLENSAAPLEAIAANNVVDGDALFKRWRADPAPIRARLQQAGATAAELTSAGREIDALGDAIDAIGDALTAEAAYQMVRGNTSRTAATLKAIADGDAPPPELEVTRMPRTGISLTHRVVALIDGTASGTPGWAGADRSARAAAEPLLNAWAGRLIGDARAVRCTIEQLSVSAGGEGDATGGETVIATHTRTLSDLAIAPLDFVYGVGSAVESSAADEALTEIEERLLWELRRGGNGPAPPPPGPGASGAEAGLRLQHARPADLGPGQITLFDAIEQARAIRAMLEGARGVDPDDLLPPDQASSGTIDLTDLERRTVAAEDAFLAAAGALTTLTQEGDDGGANASAEQYRAALLAMGRFGVERSLPLSGSGDDPLLRDALRRQARAVLDAALARVERLQALREASVSTTPDPGSDPNAPLGATTSDDAGRRRDGLIERLRNVFGATFVALPRFTCEAAAAADLRRALDASEAIQDGDALAVHTWYLRAERVRDNLARFAAPLRGADVLGLDQRFDPRVAQLPFAAGDRWVGLPATDRGPQPGKLSLVIQAGEIDPSQPMAGLWIDEWVEVVPGREETTALAFQFNPPDACAPQSVLLAVPPDPGSPWTAAMLYRVLAETLDLAKLRAIDMESLTEAAHYLPALFLAFNAQDDAVSTDFTPLTR